MAFGPKDLPYFLGIFEANPGGYATEIIRSVDRGFNVTGICCENISGFVGGPFGRAVQ
jgi:hypothetical protein